MKCATCDVVPSNLVPPAASTPPAKWKERGSLMRRWSNWLAKPIQDETAAPGRKRVIVPRWYW